MCSSNVEPSRLAAQAPPELSSPPPSSLGERKPLTTACLAAAARSRTRSACGAHSGARVELGEACFFWLGTSGYGA